MLNLKKTAVAVLALGSSVAFAGTMGPVCAPGNVTVPCEMQAWDFGVQALYLKAARNSSSANYIADTELNGNNRLVDNDPDWGWGFKLEGSYHFLTGNDLNLNWYHLGDSKETRTFSGNTSLINQVNPGRQVFSIDPQWDAVNLELGQHVDFGQFKNIRFHGGVQYARIKNDIRVTGYNVAGVNTYGYAEDAKFTGFGPRIGTDMSFDMGNGFAVYANGAVAVLAGDSDLSATLTPVNPAGVATTVSGSRTTLVPELEAKLGAKYTYAMAQGDLTLDAGYMWVDYLNVQTTAALNDTDFGVHGPYVGLKWVGTVA